MMRRLTIYWPPLWALACAALIYVVFQAMFVYEEMITRVPLFSLPDEGAILLGITIVLVAMYAVYRVMAYHPAWRPHYYLWLANTHWTSRKPLLLGPVHLVWQDAVLLGIAFALSWPRARWHGVQVFQAFLMVYALLLGLTHCRTGQKAWGYVTLFGFGFLALCVHDVPIFCAVASVVYGLGFLGLRAALARFPWQENLSLMRMINASLQAGHIQMPIDQKLGWPYDRLGPPGSAETEHSWDYKWVAGVLIGWLFFVANFTFFGDGGYLGLYYGLAVGIVGRLSLYCNGYLPPIDLPARWTTGRWIIPGYDQVFIAPLTALAIGVAAWYAPDWLAVQAVFLTPVAVTLSWWILTAMPPNLRVWRLTGNHRIAPGIMKAARP